MFASLTDAELAELMRTVHRGYLRSRNEAAAHGTASAAWLPMARVMTDCSYVLSDVSAEQGDRVLATVGAEQVAWLT